MTPHGTYDGNLQMFCETPRELDMPKLRFLRWLAERDKLEHPAQGASAGDLVTDVVEAQA
jgi:hypothetical protein